MVLMLNSTGQTLKQWMALVDAEVLKITECVGYEDLVDWGFYDALQDDMTPEEAAREIIENDGTWTEALEW